MRIHLGHHFYGAGNLGDDFMVAGFLNAMRQLAPEATFTGSVPFPLDPLRSRFPQVDWRPYDPAERADCIRQADAWLGLGGSPFQSAQSRWFVDHLLSEAALCRTHGKRMFYLGIGVQSEAELADNDVRTLCHDAAAIWTRDDASAGRLARLAHAPSIAPAADLAHLFFRDTPPPRASAGRVTLVANFDYGAWPGATAALAAVDDLHPQDRVWLAQESRELPGAERALFASLAEPQRARWRLVVPDEAPASREAGNAIAANNLQAAFSRWPSGEWLLTSRFHAALAGAWSGSKIVIVTTNEKLRAAAAETGARVIAPDASRQAVAEALSAATPSPRPVAQAERAYSACAAFVAAVGR